MSVVFWMLKNYAIVLLCYLIAIDVLVDASVGILGTTTVSDEKHIHIFISERL